MNIAGRFLVVAACLALTFSAAADVLLNQKIAAPPSAQNRYTLSHASAARGTLTLHFSADFLSCTDSAPRHVFHLWADPLNRIDATYNPIESRLEVFWTANTQRACVRAHDLYWQGQVTHRLDLVWEPATDPKAPGPTHLALFIDGQPTDQAEVPALAAAPTQLILGAADAGLSFTGQLQAVQMHDSPVRDFAGAAALPDGPVWQESAAELAQLAQFNASRHVAYLAHVRSPRHGAQADAAAPKEITVYGIKMMSIGAKTIAAGWLEQQKPDVLYGPGGGADPADEDVARRVVQYVRAGHGYFGICAGAVYAMNVGLLDQSKQIKFSGLQQMALHWNPQHPIFANVESFIPSTPHTAYYMHYSGPTWLPDAFQDATPLMMFPDGETVAMWDVKLGAGRIVVSSPHPELDSFGSWRASSRNALQMRRIFRNAMYHVAGMLETPAP